MSKKKVFLVGDFFNNTGPAIANRNILKTLENDYKIFCSSKRNIFFRIIESIIYIVKSDIILICSKSNLNFIVINIAKFLKKKIFYVMHGYSTYEAKINNPDISDFKLKKYKSYDNFIFSNVNKVICVSKFQMEYMKKILPNFSESFDYIYNIVDVSNIKKYNKNNRFNNGGKKIMSVGGGVRQKNNISIVKALDELDVSFTVVGADSNDGKEIKKYKFVEWIDYLPQNELFELMSNMDLYIQNSTFETFGLTIIEALYSGASILISNNVGCKNLFSNIVDDDIIFDVNNIEEIRTKVKKLLNNSNNERLLKGFMEKEITIDGQRERFKFIFKNF